MPAITPDQNPSVPPDPTSMLAELILAFLAPMFLTVAGGNIAHARLAAAHTLESYRTRTDCDLILVGQIIAFGLAALGSLSLALTEGLSLPMILRLRGSAQGSSRAGEQNRRTLKENHLITASDEPTNPTPAPQDAGLDEAQVVAAVATATQRVAEVRAEMAKAETAATAIPRPTAQPSSAVHAKDQHIQTLWANAFTDVANEIAAEMSDLPPAQRKIATVRAAALSSSAHELLSGNTSTRPRPGDRMFG